MDIEHRAFPRPTQPEGSRAPALSMMERMALHQVATRRRLTVGKGITHSLCERGLMVDRGGHHLVTPAGFRALHEDAILARPGASAMPRVHPNASPPRLNPFGTPRR